MTTNGNLDVSESGEAEFELPQRPQVVEAFFVDGLPDCNEASCCYQGDDRVWIHMRTEGHHERRYYAVIRWRVGKPRKIWWKAN